MRINDDFARPVLVQTSDMAWMPSPAPGVDRRMLFRIGDEVARATSIVRYAPQSQFPRHAHGGGEEILVLEGVFQDEHGDYPAGSYFRNPPGTSHVPASADGCTIFVRLWQFRQTDLTPVIRRPEALDFQSGIVERHTRHALFDDGQERVSLEAWTAGAAVVVDNSRGLEFLVVSGSLEIEAKTLRPQSWARLQAGTPLQARAGVTGVRLWIRDAPALHPDVCILPQTARQT